GVTGVVATLGTALTRDHAHLLRRYADRILVVYDGDDAGLSAGERGVKLLLEESFDVALVKIPDGLDPADLVVERGGAVLVALIESARDFFESLFDEVRSAHDLKSVSGRASAVDRVLDVAVHVGDPVKRDLLLRQTADEFRVSEDALRERL